MIHSIDVSFPMGRRRLIPDGLLKLPLVGKGSSTQHVNPCIINGQSCA
jgi:hypothetical protein